MHLAHLRSSAERPHVIALPSSVGRHREDSPICVRAITPNPASSDLIEAYKHLKIALTAFRTQITAVTSSNWLSCVAFSLHIVVVNLDMGRRAPIADFQAVVVDPVKALRTTLTMRNSIRRQLLNSVAVVNIIRQHAIKAGHARAVKPSQMWQETMTRLDVLLLRLELHTGQEVATLHVKPEDYRDFMRDFSCDEPPSDSGADCRLLAAVSLKGWAQQNWASPSEWSGLCAWQWCLTPTFMSLLAGKDEAALVVVIYWCVMISRVSPRWYLDGWAQRAAIASLRHIGPGWDDMLAWPKSELGLDRVDETLEQSPIIIMP